jgi:hypothetical protein
MRPQLPCSDHVAQITAKPGPTPGTAVGATWRIAEIFVSKKASGYTQRDNQCKWAKQVRRWGGGAGSMRCSKVLAVRSRLLFLRHTVQPTWSSACHVPGAALPGAASCHIV